MMPVAMHLTSDGDVASLAVTLTEDVVEEILARLAITLTDKRGNLPVQDQDIFRACSLVCRDWVRPAQRHVFRHIALLRDNDMIRFCTLIEASPPLAGYVHSVALGTPPAFNPLLLSISPNLLDLRLLPVLPRAHILLFYLYPEIENNFAAVWQHLRAALPNITSLHLKEETSGYNAAASLELLFRFAYAFPRLIKLEMSGLSYRELHATPPQLLLLSEIPVHDLKLHSLIISSYWHDVLLDYAVLLAKYDFIGHRQLHHLEVNVTRGERDTELIDTFLNTIGDTLQSLSLRMRDPSAADLIGLLPLARSCGPDITVTLITRMRRCDLEENITWDQLVTELQRQPLRAKCILAFELDSDDKAVPVDYTPHACVREAKCTLEEAGIQLLLHHIE